MPSLPSRCTAMNRSFFTGEAIDDAAGAVGRRVVHEEDVEVQTEEGDLAIKRLDVILLVIRWNAKERFRRGHVSRAADDIELGKREDEATAPAHELRLALQERRAEMPRKNDHVVGGERARFGLRDDGDLRARRITAEFVGVDLGDARHELGRDAGQYRG